MYTPRVHKIQLSFHNKYLVINQQKPTIAPSLLPLSKAKETITIM